RELWLLVLFFSGISFVGYLARHAIGSAKGYQWAGVLGGIVSSTAVTLTFARLSRREPPLARALAIGAVGAGAMVFPRIFIATLVLNRDVAAWIGRLTGAAFAVAVVIFVLSLRRSSADSKRLEGPKNPLQLWPALQMALTFQVVLFVVQYVQRGF